MNKGYIALFAVAGLACLSFVRMGMGASHVADAAPSDGTFRVTSQRAAARGTPVAQPVEADPVAVGRTAYLRKEADGHYWTTAYINGTPVRFMVDTGASTIALTERDARRIGLDPATLPHTAQISTANGRVSAAALTLDEVKIERVKATDVQAVVIEDGLETSLLGMSFLNQMRSWEATPRALMIRQ